jgi:hypothetical protein
MYSSNIKVRTSRMRTIKTKRSKIMVWRNERKREGGGERVKGDSYTISHVAIIGIVSH